MDEVELPEHARDTRTGLRRLAPEIEAARDKIIDHFEDKPFAELKEFVQKLLETEEDETKRIGALAARVYLLRKRIIHFEETVEFVPATEPLGERDVADDETGGRGWARVRVLENCEVNGMRLPKGIIVDVSAADAQRLIDAGHAELREAADPKLSEEDAALEEDVAPEEDAAQEEDAAPEEDSALEEDAAPEEAAVPKEDAASKSAGLLDTDEDIQEDTAEEIEAEVAEVANKPEEEEVLEAEDAGDESDVEPVADDEENVETDAETLAASESAGDDPEPVDEESDEASVELLDTKDHALATAIAETVEAFKEIDEALASDSAKESAVSNNKNGQNGENDKKRRE